MKWKIYSCGSQTVWQFEERKSRKEGERERGREGERESLSGYKNVELNIYLFIVFILLATSVFLPPLLLCLSLFLLLLRCLLLLRLRPHSLRLPIHKNKIQQNPIAIEFESSRIESNLLYNEVDVDNGDASSDVDGDVDSAVSRRLCLVDFHSHSLSLFDCLLLLSALLLLLLSSL